MPPSRRDGPRRSAMKKTVPQVAASLSPSEGLSRKQQIARVAMEIISEEGLHNLVLVNIARRIGVTDAALYKHFRSKNDILLFMIDEVEDAMRTELAAQVRPAASPVEQLHDLLVFQLDFIERNKGIPRIIFSECLRQQDPEIARKLAGLLQRRRKIVSDLLRGVVRSGQAPKDLNVEAACTIFFGMLQSAVVFWSLAGFSYSLSAKNQSLWDEYRKILQ